MTAPPIFLLDIDGVINTLKPGWGAPPHKALCAGLTIRWAPALAHRIRNLHRTGAADVRWASTWCGAPDQLASLARQLHLDLPPAFTDRPAHTMWAGLKVEAALDVLASGRRLVWADDCEVDAARDLFPALAAAEREKRALLIAPQSNRGLQPADLDEIERFCGSGAKPVSTMAS